MIINDQIQYFISVFYNHKVVRCGLRSHRIIVSWECRFGYNVIHASFRPEWRRENVLVKEEDRVKEGELENGSLCFSPSRFFVKPIHFFKIGCNILVFNMLYVNICYSPLFVERWKKFMGKT